MSSESFTHRIRPLAAVATATTIVAGFPVAVVWWLRTSGTLTEAPLAVALGMTLSLLLSYLGRVIWETRPGSEDLLFSELMIWGYLHRLRSQRRLADVARLLAPISDGRAGPVRSRPGRNVKLLEQLVSGLETNDPYLHGHSRRVARHSWMIARQMGLPGDEVARIRTAAAIHDVGKVNTPQAILHKPGRLSDEEYEVIKRHPGEGADMAAVLDDEGIVAIVRHHHERADGSGYPAGLAGDQIPVGARIVAVADTFDAITSARPYRAASAHKNAIDILRAEAGTRLDPDVVRAFCNHYAGRRPLAIWSFIAGLPERFLSWLSGGAASLASAAKVVAVAAIVGTTAASATVFAKPPRQARPRPRASAQAIAPASYTAYASNLPSSQAAPGAKAAGSRATARRGRRSLRHSARPGGPLRPAAGPAPAPPQAAGVLPAAAVSSGSTPAPGVVVPVANPVQASSPAGGAGRETPPTVIHEEAQGKAGEPISEKELAAKKAREEAAAKARAEKEKARKEAAAKAKAEKEAAAKKAREEAAAKAKAEREAAAKKAREEAAAKARAEREAAAKKAREEAGAKAKAEKEAPAAAPAG